MLLLTFVVKPHRPSVGWCLDPGVFAIKRAATVWKIPLVSVPIILR